MSFTPLRPPEATAKSIEDLLRDVASGKIRVPQFQRNFRWQKKHILDLFDSIYRGYPIGSFLFWDTDKTDGSAARFGPVSLPASPKKAYLVIDGQQRLTTLAATLLREREPEAPRDEDFLVFFDLDSATFKIPRPKEVRPSYWLPLNEVVDTIRYLEWLEKLPRNADRDRYVQVANQVARALRDYKVPVYIVRSEDEGELRRIFERLNSSGMPLESVDIFRAITGKRDDLDVLQETVGRLEFGELDKDLLLGAIKVILEVERGDRWEQLKAMAPEELGRAITETGDALARVIQFLQDDAGVSRIELLPYRDPIRVLAKLFHWIPEPSNQSRAMLSKWLWRGAISGRHAMNESQVHATLRLLSSDEERSVRALCSQLDGIEPRGLKTGRHDFRSASTKLMCNVLVSLGPLHVETGEPTRVSSLIARRGSEAFEQLVPRRRVHDKKFEAGNTFRGTANRIIHPHLFDASILDALRGIPADRTHILESHGVCARAAVHLRGGRYEEFLRLRAETLIQRAEAFFRKRCGFP